MALPAWIGGLLEPLAKVLDEVHYSGEEKAQVKLALFEAQIQLAQKGLEYEMALAEQKARVVIAEAQGESWIQRNWRPVTMLVFVYIVAHNFVVHPLGNWLGQATGWWTPIPALEIPEGMWVLLNIGLGGYLAGRTIEKVADKVGEKMSG